MLELGDFNAFSTMVACSFKEVNFSTVLPFSTKLGAYFLHHARCIFPRMIYCIEVWGSTFDTYCSSSVQIEKENNKYPVRPHIECAMESVFI